MNERVVFGLFAAAPRLCAPSPLAQAREGRTLLSHAQMRAIVAAR